MKVLYGNILDTFMINSHNHSKVFVAIAILQMRKLNIRELNFPRSQVLMFGNSALSHMGMTLKRMGFTPYKWIWVFKLRNWKPLPHQNRKGANMLR